MGQSIAQCQTSDGEDKYSNGPCSYCNNCKFNTFDKGLQFCPQCGNRLVSRFEYFNRYNMEPQNRNAQYHTGNGGARPSIQQYNNGGPLARPNEAARQGENPELEALRREIEQLKSQKALPPLDAQEGSAKEETTPYEKLRSEIAILKVKNAEYKSKLDDAEGKLQAGGNGEVGELGEKLLEVEGMLREVTGKLGEAEGRATEAEGKLTEVEGKLSETEGRLAETEGKLSETEEKLNEVEGQLGEAETKLKDSEARNVKAMEKHKEMEGEMENLESSQKEKMKKLKNNMDDLEEALEDANREKIKLSRRFESLETENNEMQETLDKTRAACKKAEDESFQNQLELSKSEKKLMEKQSELSQLEEKFQLLESNSEQQRVKLEAELSKIKSEIDVVQEEKDATDLKMKKLTRKSAEFELMIEELNDSLKKKDASIEELQMQATVVEQQKAQIRALTSEVDTLKVVEQEYTKRASEYVQKEVLDQATQEAERNARVTELETKNQELQDKVVNLERHLKFHKGEEEKLSSEVEQLQGKVQEFRKEKFEVQDKLDELEHELTRLKKQNAQLEEDIKVAEAAAADRNSARSENVHSMEEQITTLKKSLQEAETKVFDAELNLKKAERLLEEAKEESENAKEEHQKTVAKVELSTTRIAELEASQISREAKSAQLQSDLEENKKHIEELQNQNDQLNAEVKRLQGLEDTVTETNMELHRLQGVEKEFKELTQLKDKFEQTEKGQLMEENMIFQRQIAEGRKRLNQLQDENIRLKSSTSIVLNEMNNTHLQPSPRGPSKKHRDVVIDASDSEDGSQSLPLHTDSYRRGSEHVLTPDVVDMLSPSTSATLGAEMAQQMASLYQNLDAKGLTKELPMTNPMEKTKSWIAESKKVTVESDIDDDDDGLGLQVTTESNVQWEHASNIFNSDLEEVKSDEELPSVSINPAN